jgi:predicted nucleic acid-binding protein
MTSRPVLGDDQVRALFIDTNVLLSFLKMRPEDLEELRKVCLLIRRERIDLYLPEQVRDEFRRNRASAIQTALTTARERRRPEYPGMMREHPQFAELAALDGKAGQLHSEILRKAADDARTAKLLADNVIDEMFSLARLLPLTTDLIDLARQRSERGNPPGKDRSLGDAIIWESLLAAAPSGLELHLVATDSDWSLPLDVEDFDEYLAAEWAEKRDGQIRYYRRLSQFCSTHFPDIRIAAEAEKDMDIVDLSESSSFRSTHVCIRALERHSSFTPGQGNALLTVFLENPEVSSIITDADVYRFAQRLIGQADLDPEMRRRLADFAAKAVANETS